MGVNHSLVSYFSNASPVVKLVMLILLFASILSWALIFNRNSYFKQARKQLNQFHEKFWDTEDLAHIHNALAHRKSTASLTGLASLFQAGFKEFARYKKLGAPASAALEGVDRAIAIAEFKELDKMEQRLSMLATIGSTSPYIGLFGTVWGIMMSFQALSAVQQATMPMVAPGISEALIATAMGLFAAIPALIAYNRFTNALNRMANQYATFREEFLAIVARQLQMNSAGKPVAQGRYIVDAEHQDEEEYA